MSKAILLSGGIDSIALAYWKKPDIAFTLNYGQSPARKEIQTSVLVAKKLNIAHHIIDIDCSSLGSGDLINQKALSVSPSSEWWPFRNQLLITLACMKGVSFGITELMTGSVLSDGFHKDGTVEFYQAIDELMVYQEGNIRVTCPAIKMTSAELVKTSGIPNSLLFWAHSCHKGNVPCGQCRGCNKYREVMHELGHI
jgi:7-cyano-7-deazaguanine synthase